MSQPVPRRAKKREQDAQSCSLENGSLLDRDVGAHGVVIRIIASAGIVVRHSVGAGGIGRQIGKDVIDLDLLYLTKAMEGRREVGGQILRAKLLVRSRDHSNGGLVRAGVEIARHHEGETVGRRIVEQQRALRQARKRPLMIGVNIVEGKGLVCPAKEQISVRIYARANTLIQSLDDGGRLPLGEGEPLLIES